MIAKNSTRYWRNAAVSLPVLAFAGLAATAQAQTKPVVLAAAEIPDADTIIVTGTRQSGVKAADSAAPIQVLGAEAPRPRRPAQPHPGA